MCSKCGHYHCTPGCPNYEPVIVETCSECKRPIYVGDEYVDSCEGAYCRECLEEMTATEIVRIMGGKIETAKVEDGWDE